MIVVAEGAGQVRACVPSPDTTDRRDLPSLLDRAQRRSLTTPAYALPRQRAMHAEKKDEEFSVDTVPSVDESGNVMLMARLLLTAECDRALC